MNTHRRPSLAGVAVLVGLFVGAGPPAAANVVLEYSLNPIDDPGLAMSIRFAGAEPEDSVLPFRWYWSYEERFPIAFEWVGGAYNHITDGSDRAAVESALATWNSVAESSIKGWMGDYNGTWAGGNRENEIGWIYSGWTSLGLPTNAIAVARIWYAPSTMIQVETDILFNGEYFAWYTATDGTAGTQYVEHIALHELGHAFSLADLYGAADAARTMYGYSGPGNEDVTLDPGDEAALRYAYPAPIPLPGAAALGAIGLGLAGLTRTIRRR